MYIHILIVDLYDERKSGVHILITASNLEFKHKKAHQEVGFAKSNCIYIHSN